MKDLEGLERISLLLFDVDGILTDGILLVDEEGRVSKRFHINDGLGLKLAMRAGIEVGFISGHDSEAVRRRARDLGVSICHTGVKDKLPVFRSILEETGRSPEETAYMGDDLIDLSILTRVGLAITVPEAHPLVLETAHHVTRRAGGGGAVREMIEDLLAATGRLEELLRHYR